MKPLALTWSAIVVACLLHVGVGAQTARDPTRAPPTAGLPTESSASPAGSALEKGGFSIIVRDGKSYLAVGTRLYAQGQMLGAARVERITETEVWLQEGRALRKIARFEGIQRRVVSPTAAMPTAACAASAPKPSARRKNPANSSSTKTTPPPACVDAQP